MRCLAPASGGLAGGCRPAAFDCNCCSTASLQHIFESSTASGPELAACSTFDSAAAACRKTLSLYLTCLADAATASTASGAHEPEAGRPQALDLLQAAAAYLATPQAAGGSKVWEGCGKLAR
jgi:hypothetical protein